MGVEEGEGEKEGWTDSDALLTWSRIESFTYDHIHHAKEEVLYLRMIFLYFFCYDLDFFPLQKETINFRSDMTKCHKIFNGF